MALTELFSAGSNAQGQLAHGNQEDSHCFRRCMFSEEDDKLSKVINVMSVAAGANHTLVLSQLSDGTTYLWGCGDGRRGQLGHRYQIESGTSSTFRRIDFSEYVGYQITFIAASWETSFVALSHTDYGDILLSMGSDDFGDLGIGSSSERKESGCHHRINFAHLFSNMDQSLIRILELQAGPHNAVALLSCEENGSGGAKTIVTVGWGASRHGQLGTAKLLSEKPQSITPKPAVIPIRDVHKCAVGNQHIVFLTSTGSVVALGSNRKGQISHLNSAENIRAIESTWNGTYLVRQNPNSAYDWCILATGSNSRGQLTRSFDLQSQASDLQIIDFPDGALFQALACGSEHILVSLRKADHKEPGITMSEVWGWGWNEHGNLGLGHTDDLQQPTPVWTQRYSQNTKGRVTGVWAGCGTSWIAVETDGQ